MSRPLDKHLQIVGLRIGRETLGLPISLVREIVRVPEITPVPNAPDHIEGVINLRGNIIAVVDLSKRFGEAAIERNSKSRIVVVEMEERWWDFLSIPLPKCCDSRRPKSRPRKMFSQMKK